MARIISTAIAPPSYRVSQDQAKEFARHHFSSRLENINALLPIFEHAEIESRHFCVPPEWFLTSKDFRKKNEIYIEWATKLAEEASRKCLENVDITSDEIDYIIFVSTTGLATPSIDARLINIMKMRSDIRRAPVWGFGCLGGAAGLSMAFNYIKAYPDSKVLVVAVELCGLTFQYGDFSKSNFVAIALFADGAAAALIAGDGDGPEIIATESKIWPDSLDVMGWNFLNDGMQVVFSKAIPAIVSRHAHENISSFVGKYGLSLGDLEYYLIHPGGVKVIEAYERSLGINSRKLQLSREILKNYGNMSSATILYILDSFLQSDGMEQGNFGLITSLGPGFSSECLLFKI